MKQYEQVKKGNIAIIKHTDDGETQIETPEEGAEFAVYLKSAGSYDNAKDSERDYLVCDENGFAQTKDLPYGRYTVQQIKGWEGRELLKPFDVFVSENGETYRYLINNANFYSYVKVVKIDSTTGKTIPASGIGFHIYDPSGSQVQMTFTYPTVTTIDTFYTDGDGMLITPEKLEYGMGYLFGVIPVVWLGLLIAPCLKDGLLGLVQQFGAIMQNPFRIELCEDSVKAVLVLLLAYGIAIGVYLSSDHNYRRREEHGSAKWGMAGSVNKKYANKVKTENKLLTQNVAIGLDGRKHRRNLNVLVCGGSGAGKTRFFAKPNIMNANTSFVVLDPKGELLRDTGHLLKEHGYDIKVLDLINIVGNCDEFLYLGGNEQSTHEYVSKLLGKETIDTNTYGRSRGRNGSYSTNYQLTGRELMTPDEVRMLDNRYALLFIRGERPVQDLKYDILHHPNVGETTDGGAPVFTHGEDTRSIAAMSFAFDKNAVKQAQKIEPELHDFELLSEEELEELIELKEKKENEESQS